MAIKQRPDLILLDMQLPVRDGFEVLRVIRNNQDLNNIRIITVTSMAMTGDRETILKAGADDYISEPVDTRELPKIIKRVLDL